MKKPADRSKEVIIHKKTLFGTVGRWPRPLNRGGRLMEVVSLLIYNKYFRDFDNWPFNRVWLLNRGSTVFKNELKYTHQIRLALTQYAACAKS